MNRKGVVLQGREREIIFNVIKVFESEKVQAHELLQKLAGTQTVDGILISHKLFSEISEFLKKTARVTDRVVQSTGVNKNTVTRIKREGATAEATGMCNIPTPVRKPRGKSTVLDSCDLKALSKLISRLSKTDKDVLSLNKILAKARNDLNFRGGVSTLRKILIKQLGYKFTRGPNQWKQITIKKPTVEDDITSEEDIATEYLETVIEEVEVQDESTITLVDSEDMQDCSSSSQEEGV